MGPRRDLRRTISKLQKQVQFSGLGMTVEERNSLTKRLKQLKEELRENIKGKTLTVTDEEIDERADVIANNPELAECFGAFWYLMLPQTVDGILQKPGYVKFQLCLQSCLVSSLPEADAIANAEADWSQDSYLFGPMNKTAFFGVLYEVLHMWIDIEDPRAYAIFAWNVLTSIADLTCYPPALRVRRTIGCVTGLKEAELLKAYRADTDMRKRIFEKVNSTEFTSEANIKAMARTSQRTKQLTMHDDRDENNMRAMLEILHRQAIKTRQDEDSGTDTDDEKSMMTDGSLHAASAQEDPTWRRAENERLRKEEEDRLANMKNKRKPRRKLKNLRSRSYFLEAGRGEGIDSFYDVYGNTWGGKMSAIRGGNWIGQSQMDGGWRQAALMEFLENYMSKMTEGKSAEEIHLLSDKMDMRQMRVVWLQELARQEADRTFVENVQSGLATRAFDGMFGIVGKGAVPGMKIESRSRSRGRSASPNSRSQSRGSPFALVEARFTGSEAAPRPKKATKSGREVLDLLRNAPRINADDLSDVLLTSTGELGRAVIKAHQDQVKFPQGSASQNDFVEGWVETLTPSYSRNQRSKSARPVEAKTEPFLTLTLGPDESERRRDKAKNLLDTLSTNSGKQRPPSSVLRALQPKGPNLSPRSLSPPPSHATPHRLRPPGSAGSDGSHKTTATGLSAMTIGSTASSKPFRTVQSRGVLRFGRSSPTKKLSPLRSSASALAQRSGVLESMPLLLRKQLDAVQALDRERKYLREIGGFQAIDISAIEGGTEAYEHGGYGDDDSSNGSNMRSILMSDAAEPATEDADAQTSPTREISTPGFTLNAPPMSSPPPQGGKSREEVELEFGKGILADQGDKISRQEQQPRTQESIVPGSRSAKSVKPSTLPLDDDRVEALIHEGLRLHARIAMVRDEGRGPASKELMGWLEDGPFGSTPPLGLDADSWVSGESLATGFGEEDPSLSPLRQSQITFSSSSGSVNTSNKGVPVLIMPPLMVILERLYIKTCAGLDTRPRWAGAGSTVRKRKEEDAKHEAETGIVNDCA